MDTLPVLGVGMGYRPALRGHLTAEPRRIDLVEVIADHFLGASPERAAELEWLGSLVPVVPHGLSLSIGSAGGLDELYLDALARLVERLAPPWLSEHLGFTRAAGLELGHFAPLPFTWEAVEVVRRNLDRARARLGVPLLLENITAPFLLPGAQMTEAEFLRAVLEGSDTGLLLDLTNLYVNGLNLGIDVKTFLGTAPMERVVEIHVAGARTPETSRAGVGRAEGPPLGRVGRSSACRYADPGAHPRPAPTGAFGHADLADSHDAPVPEAVWALVERVLAIAPVRALVLERDDRLAEFDEIDADLRRAQTIWEQARVDG